MLIKPFNTKYFLYMYYLINPDNNSMKWVGIVIILFYEWEN